MPVIDEETVLQLQTSNEAIPQVRVGESNVYMEQNRYLNYMWTANYWPLKEGWQAITNTDGSIDWFYVYSRNDWSGIKGSEKITATKRYASFQKNNPAKNADKIIETKTEVPIIYFFVVFLLSCSVLWLEKKLHDH